MIDSFELMARKIREDGMLAKLGLEARGYGIVTLHRPSNVDRRETLELIVDQLAALGERLPLVFPVHPRTRARLEEFGLAERLHSRSRIQLLEPLPYIEFMRLVVDCAVAITDSGGIQEETSYLGIPCLTLRESTERPVTVTEGTNRLIKGRELALEVERALAAPLRRQSIDLWDGRTAQRVAESLRKHVASHGKP